ncbi:phospholipase A and acyltransferase 3-like [Physella acuta]|uniref:phospholipase A and acyltransferase 3-like n=1 Tax=Physella acuta TaxID=109671 RepID=UPI0027DC5A5A|nr:phospholipase A and acyltransferase 3-like [Physella acuta]XP_059173876.1 phospholipase A and acyltransferase 3-like [Physella acuta]XP_059173877.1 phospholipase A and acyltransferase 3-like [Physella acuta]XP_059173878.1 phospholipase A and acyltransferase 3-like [Physella acuta]XP_059173879.1 phospholipase A and acyltransferase 3-like [Physella acuta]
MANDRMNVVEFNRQQNRSLLKSLEPGDLIKVKSGLFYHWCVFIGDAEVVHVAGYNLESANSTSSFTGLLNGYTWSLVKKENIWKVVKNNLMEKDNQMDKNRTPFAGDEVVSRALSKIGYIKYHAVLKNCEHFAKWCRNNTEESSQSQIAVLGTAVSGFVVGGPLGALFAGASAIAKLLYDVAQDEKEEKETSVYMYKNRYM